MNIHIFENKKERSLLAEGIDIVVALALLSVILVSAHLLVTHGAAWLFSLF